MDVVERKVENQVQFWSLLGPFFVLLSIAVLLFKVSAHWYFPVSALIGLPLCVKWKMKGMAAALGCLFLFAGISFQTLELDDRYWHVGLSLAMAFSFIVLTLSLEEVQGLVGKLQLESHSRLDNFLILDEKSKAAELAWSFEKEKIKGEIGELTLELTRTQEDKQNFYKLAQLAKDELIQVRSQHDQLLQDLLYKKQQIAQLYERVDETEMTVQEFVNSDSEKQIQTLKELNHSLEREKETFKAQVNVLQVERQNCQKEQEDILSQLQAYQSKEHALLVEKELDHQRLEQQQAEFLLLKNQSDLMINEIEKLRQTEAKSRNNIEQLCDSELLYKEMIEQSARKIIHLEDKIAEIEQEKERLTSLRDEIQEKYQLQQEVYQAHLNTIEKKLNDEKSKREAQIKDAEQQMFEIRHGEMKILQDRYQKMHDDHMQTQSDLEAARECLDKTQKRENECRERIESLNQELELNKQRVVDLTERREEDDQIFMKRMECLQNEFELARTELLETQSDLIAKNEMVAFMTSKIDHLVDDLKEQKNLYQNTYSDLQAAEECLGKTDEKEKEDKKHIEYLRQELQLSQQIEQDLAQGYEQNHKVLRKEIDVLQQNYQAAQNELIETQSDLIAKNEMLVLMQSTIDDLVEDLKKEKTLCRKSIEHNEKLEEAKLALEKVLRQTQVELKESKELLELQSKEKQYHSTDSLHKSGSEAMYKQLKNQFYEKCQVLDATRRELFLANEKLLQHTKEYEEQHLYDPFIDERNFQQYVVEFEKQCEQMQINYQEEIDDLTQLIGDLLKQIKE
ncbi:MAG: hypothetical protein ACH350_08710 [Parachlamydiaceae bacterium]